jgi:hypothetical protein
MTCQAGLGRFLAVISVTFPPISTIHPLDHLCGRVRGVAALR